MDYFDPNRLVDYRELHNIQELGKLENLSVFILTRPEEFHCRFSSVLSLGSGHATFVYGNFDYLRQVISTVAESQMGNHPLNLLKETIRHGARALLFLSQTSCLFGLFAERGLAWYATAVYFKGLVAVLESNVDVDYHHKINYLARVTLDLLEQNPRVDLVIPEPRPSDEEVCLILFDLHGIKNAKREILRNFVEEKSGGGNLVMGKKKWIIRGWILTYGALELLYYVKGQCGLIAIHNALSCNLSVLLRLVSVRAMCICRCIVREADIYLPKTLSITEFPVDYLVYEILNPNVDISTLHVLLKQAYRSLIAVGKRLGPHLSLLDPSVHSLGLLYLLEAFSNSLTSKRDARNWVGATSSLIEHCDKAQIQLAPEKFISLCRRFSDLVMQLGDPKIGITPLEVAISKVQTAPWHFTTLHPELLLLCLFSKSYDTGEALLVLQPEYYFATDVILYFYYGGLICLARQDYVGASDCFGSAVDHYRYVSRQNINIINVTVLEAFKKKYLLSWLGFPLDNLAHVHQLMYMDTLGCRPYFELAFFLETDHLDKAKLFADSHMEYFQTDYNDGLVKSALAHWKGLQAALQDFSVGFSDGSDGLAKSALAYWEGLQDQVDEFFHFEECIRLVGRRVKKLPLLG